MKTCPACGKSYGDDLSYCLDDGSVLTTAYQTPRGFYGNQPPPQSSSGALLWIGGALAVIVLAVVALIGLLIWFSLGDKKVAVANTVNTQPTPSPQVLKQPPTSNNANSVAVKPSPTLPSIDTSKGLDFAGTATNITAKKSSGVAINVVSRDDDFYINGGLDNKRLFGKFKNLPGRKTDCPQTAPSNSTCVQFSGDIHFGNDGSGFPAGTKAPFSMLLTFDSTARAATGTYQVGKIPRYEDMGTQHGTFRLTRR